MYRSIRESYTNLRDRPTKCTSSLVSLGALAAMIVLFMEITKYREATKKPATAAVPVPVPPVPSLGHYEELRRPETETADESNYVT